MKLIKDVRYGNIPISRIYFNNEIIYNRCINVIVTGHGVIDDILTAASETMFYPSMSAKGVINVATIATLGSDLVSDSVIRAVIELESIVTPRSVEADSIACVGEVRLEGKAISEFADLAAINLHETNDIIAKAHPHTNIEYADGRVVVSMVAVAAAKSTTVELASAITKIKCNVVGVGKNSKTTYANTHGKVYIDTIAKSKTADAMLASTNSTVDAIAVVNASDVVQIDAAMHDTVRVNDTVSTACFAESFAAGHETVGVEIHLTSDQLTQADIASREMIAVELIASANDATVHGADAHGDIDTTQVIPAILWTFPDNTSDYLLIIQAYDTDDTKLETDGILEVI